MGRRDVPDFMRKLFILGWAVLAACLPAQRVDGPWAKAWSGTPHGGVVKSFAWGPKGLVATMGSDEHVRIHLDGQQVLAFHLEHPQVAAFDDEGGRVAVGGARSAAVWDLKTGKELDRWSLGDYGTKAIAFAGGDARVVALTHNGRLLYRRVGVGGRAWGGPSAVRYGDFRWRGDAVEAFAKSGLINRDRSVKSIQVDLLDPESGALLHSCNVGKGPGQYDQLILDHPHLLDTKGQFAYVDDGAVVVRDASNDAVVRRFGKNIRRLQVTATAVTLSWDGHVRAFDLGSGEDAGSVHVPGAEDIVVGPRGRWVLVRKEGGGSEIVDLERRKRHVHDGLWHGTFTPDAGLACFWPRWGGEAKLIALDAMKTLATPVVQQLAFLRSVSPPRAAFDGSGRFATMALGNLRLIDLSQPGEHEDVNGHAGAAGGLRVTEDDRWLTTVCAPRKAVRVLDLRARDLLETTYECASWDHVPALHGRSLLVRTNDGEWRVHGLPDAQPKVALPKRGTGVPPRLDADGRYLAAVRDGRLVVHDLATGKDVSLPAAARRGTRPSWSPRGPTLAVKLDGQVALMEAPFKELRRLDVPGAPLDWSSDGQWLLVGERRDVAGVVELRTSRLRPVPEGLFVSNRLQQVKLGHHGRLLAVVDCNRGGWLFDLVSGKELLRYKGARGHFVGARFSPLGDRVLLWGSSGRDAVFTASGETVLDGDDLKLAWSDDGTLFVVRGPSVEIWPLGASRAAEVVPVGRRIDELVPSRSGRKLYLTSGARVEVWERR